MSFLLVDQDDNVLDSFWLISEAETKLKEYVDSQGYEFFFGGTRSCFKEDKTINIFLSYQSEAESIFLVELDSKIIGVTSNYDMAVKFCEDWMYESQDRKCLKKDFWASDDGESYIMILPEAPQDLKVEFKDESCEDDDYSTGGIFGRLIAAQMMYRLCKIVDEPDDLDEDYPEEDQDIILVMKQTGASREVVVDKLKKNDNDIILTVLEIAME